MKYLGFKAFVALRGPFQLYARRRRAREFEKRMHPIPGQKLIDVGGTPEFWRDFRTPLDITIVNLPGTKALKGPLPAQHEFTIVEGDGCDLSMFDDQSFEIAFSNSVIEHVGDEQRQCAFASEVSRLAPRVWVQTPSIWFPIECHTGMPFWWFYPSSVRTFFIARWKKKLPDWTDFIINTTIIRRSFLETVFSERKMWVERFFLISKSYIVYDPPQRN